MFYSYILRRAVQPSLFKTDIPTSSGANKPPQPHGRLTCIAEPESHVLSHTSDKAEEEYPSKGEKWFSLSCDRSSDNTHRDRPHPTGVGLRGVQGLRCVPPTGNINRTRKTGRLSRRPSSAPARRQHEKVVSEGRYLSPGRGRTTATEATFTSRTGDHGRRIPNAAPGVWGVEECKDLWNGLVRVGCGSVFLRWMWQRKPRAISVTFFGTRLPPEVCAARKTFSNIIVFHGVKLGYYHLT